MLRSFFGKGRRVVAGLLVGAMVLTGCTDQLVNASAPAVKRNDPCAGIRAPFVQLRKERQERLARWAAGGALAGAAIARSRNGNDPGSLLRGALIGAAVGLAGGYIVDVQKRRGSTANFRAAVNSDARGDVASTDRLLRAVTELNSCRLREVRAVVAAQRGGKLTKAQGKAQLSGILASAREDNRIINSVVSDLDRTQRTYVSALSLQGAADQAAQQRYRTAASNYTPRVSKPARTARTPSIPTTPVRVAPKRSNDQVESLSYASQDLDAGGDAHLDTIEASIDDAELLFL